MKTLQSKVAAAARRRPEAPALWVRGETITYGQVDDTARRWAGFLISALGRPASRVGVFGSRSATSYIGSLAALYSGAAFVPLNPRFPPERTRRMVQLARLDGIICDALGEAQLTEVLNGVPGQPVVLLPESRDRDRLATQPRLESLPPLAPYDVAYLLFTSGSTGLPKGVPILQSNVRAYLDWAAGRYAITPADRFSQTFDQTFDLSVHDQFLCWENGACLYSLSPVELLAPARFINRHELSVWFSVPSVVAQMRKRNQLKPGLLPTLRWSLFCGEPLPRASSEAWQAAAPNSIVENLYGPTELTIACTVYRWDPECSPALCVNDMTPIGHPYPGLVAAVVDDDLRLVAAGAAGELCVSGAQTSPGYWDDPVKTAERFVRLPELPGAVYYRTGDRVRETAEAGYVCLGRADHQIKLLGFRVELGEIEAALQRNPAVVQAVAMGWPVVEGSAQAIVAFVSGAGVDPSALRESVRGCLADYMVPSAIHVLAEMPLNANGKVDRGALARLLSEGRLSP